MELLRRIYYFFSIYTDPAERRVGKFFARVNEHDASHTLERSLIDLLQRDIARINLWTERRYKGYNYLTKRQRRELYANLELIKQDFAKFTATQSVDTQHLIKKLGEQGADTTSLRLHQEQLAYIATIQQYLAPSNGRYVYRESSSFGRLLRDPVQEQLVGDCNQIVTLYITLFAEKYDVTHLKLALLPEHVALHFCGIDIEATNGSFANYADKERTIVPAHEIVSVNLLDTTDTNFAKGKVDPSVFLESARLAYATSSHRQLVKSNLAAAYHNVVHQMLQAHDYSRALKYARQSKNHQLVETAARNGALYAMKQHDFAGARRFAGNLQDRHEITKTIDHNEAAHLYNKKQYQPARAIYSRLGDDAMVKNCYRGLYIQEQSRLGTIKTIDDIKLNIKVIRSMERYAKQSGDKELVHYVASLTKYL